MSRLTRDHRRRLNGALDQLFHARRYDANSRDYAQAVGWASSVLADLLDRNTELLQIEASNDIRMLSADLCRRNPLVCP